VSKGRAVVRGLALVVAVGSALAAAPSLRRVPSTREDAFLRGDRAGGLEAKVHLDRPEWLRPGEESTVRLVIDWTARTTAIGPDVPVALIGRLDASALHVMPGEEQAEPLSDPSGSIGFTWRLKAAEAGTAPVSLTLSERRYLESGSEEEDVLWARFLAFDIRHAPVSAGAGLIGIAAGVLIWFFLRAAPSA
jgi:hypothetical protein